VLRHSSQSLNACLVSVDTNHNMLDLRGRSWMLGSVKHLSVRSEC
jgi:hypothetical protein